MIRAITVADLRAALAGQPDWQPIALEIEGGEGCSAVDLDGVLKRSNPDSGEVTFVLSGVL